jgi:hypothetical protein
VRNFIGNDDFILVWRIPSSEEAILRDETFLAPCSFVLQQHIIHNTGTIDYVVVSRRNDLFIGQNLRGDLVAMSILTGNWLQMMKIILGSQTYTHPVLPFHFFQDGLLKRRSGIDETLWTHSKEQGIPVEDDTTFAVKALVIEQHRVERDHEQEMS